MLAEGHTEADCNMIAAYVLASAYRKLLNERAGPGESETVRLLRRARGELRLVSCTPKAMDHIPLTGPAIERLIPEIDAHLDSLSPATERGA